jgi:hypothetical protein
VRMLVSWRHIQRSQPIGPSRGWAMPAPVPEPPLVVLVLAFVSVLTPPPRKPLTSSLWIHVLRSPHIPVTMSSPTSTSITPPTTWMVRWRRRSHPEARPARSSPAAMRMNGSPRPSPYAVARVTLRATCGSAVALAMTSTAARVGPVHGAQPRAKTAPSNGAPASPALGRHAILASR